MKPTRTNKLYNYLVNTYGLSKELVLEYVDNRVQDLVDKHVKKRFEDNSYMEKLILNRVTNFIQNGVSTGWHYDRDSFEKYVKSCIKDEVTRVVKESYKIKVELK